MQRNGKKYEGEKKILKDPLLENSTIWKYHTSCVPTHQFFCTSIKFSPSA